MDLKKEDYVKNKLKKASIGIAGVGGLGSNVAVALARAGIGRLLIVDFDKVEERNLNRQYYFRDQIDETKVNALKKTIQNINPSVKVETLNQRLLPGSMYKPFHDVDIIIEAFDLAETKTQFIEEILLKYPNKPLIGATGVAGYGNSDRIKTIKTGNLFMVCDEDAKSSDEDMLFAPKVCLMANWQANLALEIILGEDK